MKSVTPVPAVWSAKKIESAIGHLDYFRRSPARFGGEGGHKEWQHFLVHTKAIHLLINFNLLDDRWAPGQRTSEAARIIVMVRTADGWDGDVERFDDAEVEIRPGRLEARMGPNTLRFSHGHYHLSATLRRRPISAEISLEPVTAPLLANNRPLSHQRMMSWLIVPRLLCRGTVRVGDVCFSVDEALAYHDHNWGWFSWGEDFAWEWGAAQPDEETCPWGIVFARTTDLGRRTLRGQGLFLWRAASFYRVFRDLELEVRTEGRVPTETPLKLPRIMTLLSPGGAHDLPEHLHVRARGDGDELDLTFVAEDVAQLIIPSEHDLHGITVLNEVSGRTIARGRVRGETVDMEGPSVFEFVRP